MLSQSSQGTLQKVPHKIAFFLIRFSIIQTPKPPSKTLRRSSRNRASKSKCFPEKVDIIRHWSKIKSTQSIKGKSCRRYYRDPFLFLFTQSWREEKKKKRTRFFCFHKLDSHFYFRISINFFRKRFAKNT